MNLDDLSARLDRIDKRINTIGEIVGAFGAAGAGWVTYYYIIAGLGLGDTVRFLIATVAGLVFLTLFRRAMDR
jgi:ABC-type lipopolysaccharide export system ATPase subunit